MFIYEVFTNYVVKSQIMHKRICQCILWFICLFQLQNSLMMFPSMVTQLMDKCGVVIDPQVATHAFFGVQAELW